MRAGCSGARKNKLLKIFLHPCLFYFLSLHYNRFPKHRYYLTGKINHSMKVKTVFATIACLCISFISTSQTSIFDYGSSWKYLDNGTNQGTAWTATAFDDALWASGNGQLGYGDGDEATVVGYGTDANNKYITTYFRKSISITNPSLYSSFSANVKRDDGIIVYVNGVEVYRNNLATGTITYTTLAALAADDGATAQSFSIASSAFIAGNNTIAVEIHQNAANSSDISFDMQLTATPLPVTSTLIAYNNSWKYLDNGSNQGTAWRASTFNDASWKTGNAQLGYGDGDETTIVSYGSNANKKYITTYFRKSISIADTSGYANYTLNIKRDDGAVVYINGSEVYRSNMPSGTISSTTLASTAASDDGNTAQTTTLTVSKLKKGTNVIAVEIHQNDKTSTDLSFDLELTANASGTPPPPPTATLTRGPYMNSATQTSIVIRWRSNIATNSKVSFGPTAGSTAQSVTDNTSTTEHVVTLTGLTENTLYYYTIGSTTQTLQGDAGNYFKTLPAVGSTQKIRVLAMGDMGNNSSNQVNLRNAYATYNAGKYTDIWMLMGDNAYNSGTDSEYQSNFFNIYQGTLTKNHVLWPSPGNHDYANSTARQADHVIPYYDIFSLPKSGEAGGLPSNTEAYYSYNYGNVHFVALDSYGWETGNTRLYDTLGPQMTWLKQDLAANTQKWTIVYFHHPPYTKGSHNSDTETELINIRNNVVRILERYKVDMVINGHSHVYERSYLLNGHYGLETTYNSSYAVSSSSGLYNGSANSCLYIKNANAAKNGIVYAVVGSSGQVGGSVSGYPHNAMYYSNNTNAGAMILEIENNRLDAKWLCADGIIRDSLTIMKDVNKTTNIQTTASSSQELSASWIGNYIWGTGATTRSITVTPATNSVYTVRDVNNCITDVFNISINGGSGKGAPVIENINLADKIQLYPSVAKAGTVITFISTDHANRSNAIVIDMEGRKVSGFNFTGHHSFNTSGLKPGMYRVSFSDKKNMRNCSFMITE